MRTLNRNGSVFYPLERGIDLQPIMRQVYAWMGLGMLLSAVVAAVTVGTSLIDVAANPVIFLVAIVAEFGMVLGLSAGLGRMSAGTATMLFFAYAALNGFTLSVVLLAFTSATVISVIGYTTQVDLTRMGTYLMMGVIGLVIAMIVSMFISSGPLDMLISMAGVLIFTALTAYDTQRISRMATQISIEDGQASAKLGVIGALTLYLDFVNMFLFMLRLMGGRRR
jgi:FtsH-binding integral membrane protein